MASLDAIWLFAPPLHGFPTPPPSHPAGVLVVLAMPVKNYQKRQAIQLAIHSTIGTWIDNE